MTSLVESAHTIIVWIALYDYTVTHFADWVYLSDSNWLYTYSVTIGQFAVAPIQVRNQCG